MEAIVKWEQRPQHIQKTWRDTNAVQTISHNMMPYDRTHDVTIRSRLTTNFMIFLQLIAHCWAAQVQQPMKTTSGNDVLCLAAAWQCLSNYWVSMWRNYCVVACMSALRADLCIIYVWNTITTNYCNKASLKTDWFRVFCVGDLRVLF